MVQGVQEEAEVSLILNILFPRYLTSSKCGPSGSGLPDHFVATIRLSPERFEMKMIRVFAASLAIVAAGAFASAANALPCLDGIYDVCFAPKAIHAEPGGCNEFFCGVWNVS